MCREWYGSTVATRHPLSTLKQTWLPFPGTPSGTIRGSCLLPMPNPTRNPMKRGIDPFLLLPNCPTFTAIERKSYAAITVHKGSIRQDRRCHGQKGAGRPAHPFKNPPIGRGKEGPANPPGSDPG